MDQVASLVKPVIESEVKSETLTNLLLSCIDQQAFAKEPSEIASVVGVINAACNASSTRLEGLLLLQSFLPQCDQDTFTKNATLWVQLCVKSMATDKTGHVAGVVFKLMVQFSVKVPETSKHFSSVAIASFMEQIRQGISPVAFLSSLECLEQCMVSYNGSCGPHRKVIEQFVYPMLDYTGPQHCKLIWQAARCVALLPQIGGGGTGGTVHRQAWASQHKSLCRGIHLILDELYAGLSEIRVSLVSGIVEGVTPLSLDPIDMNHPVLAIQKLTNRMASLSASLQAMMVMCYPAVKDVIVSDLLGLICRGLAVNGTSLGDSLTTHRLALASNLPKIHFSLLKLLESIILVLRSNLLPFSRLICKLVVQTLKWTAVTNWPYGTVKPFSYLRIQAYEILRVWCGIAKSGSCVADIAQQFIDLSLSDVYSEKDSVSLVVAVKTNQGSHKSKKNKNNVSALGSNDISSNMLLINKSANKGVCVAALRALQALVMSGPSKIQPSLHKTLQEVTVTVLLQVLNRVEDVPIPYSESAPRLELYRLLLQLVLDSHSLWPAPTNIALKLFSKGLHDPDAQISMFCGVAQSSVEKIIHPAYPSLSLLADVQELENCQSNENVLQALPGPSYKMNASQLNKSQHRVSDQEVEDVTDLTEEKESNLSAAAVVSSSLFKKLLVSPATPYKTLDSSSAPASNLISNVSKFNASSTPFSNAKVVVPFTTSEKEVVTSSESKKKLSGASEVSAREIDLTFSDKSDDDDDNDDDDNDDEISEIPCEVDLAAESDDDNVSMCSQTTVNTPAAEDVMLDLVENPIVSNEGKKSEVSSDTEKKEKEEDSKNTSKEECSGTLQASSENTTEKTASSKRPAEDEGKSPLKKQKPDDTVEDLTFDEDLDEESMMLSFVNVTREEEENELKQEEVGKNK